MKLNPQYLEKIASLTLDHYNQRAEEFWEGTRDHDVKQNISALLQWIEGKPPFTILGVPTAIEAEYNAFHLSTGIKKVDTGTLIRFSVRLKLSPSIVYQFAPVLA